MNTNGLSRKEAYRLMFAEYPDVLTIEQVCTVLGISKKTGYKLLSEGKLMSLKVGRSYRIAKAHLLDYLLAEAMQ